MRAIANLLNEAGAMTSKSSVERVLKKKGCYAEAWGTEANPDPPWPRSCFAAVGAPCGRGTR